MIAAELAAIVPDARETKPGQFSGPCPACGGDPRSTRFGFRDGDGRVLIHCLACGDSDAILAALDLRWRDLYHDVQHRRDPQAARRRQAREVVRRWRSAELTLTCERLRHLDSLEDQASRRLKLDPDDLLAWSVLAHVYSERPKLERDFERLTVPDEARWLTVYREHRERGNRAA